ncbi:MAG: hypothetical protein ACRDQA_06720 [Nocardioidaceae bacterium]
MAKYVKKPIEIEATQWWRNGDHPDDHVGEPLTDPLAGEEYQRQEGAVVRYYRHPDVPDDARHCDLPDTRRPNCTTVMHWHGWIDTIEGGHTACPGDWIITGIQGEVYPCEPSIFDATYEPVTEPHAAYRDAETGEYVHASYAAEHPDTTVQEQQ